ncbi:RICIN domain-containing protein [Desulfobulbus sp. US2]|nr:RICIN domain-containing protein [Desulfobulbus sp. US4]MCW5207132.1 RICIN domain-containing protein [Desulfobulbus sp. US2]
MKWSKILFIALLFGVTFQNYKTNQVMASSYYIGCRWSGTAPFCSGSCNEGEQEMAQAMTYAFVDFLPARNHFGAACWIGSKSYCCDDNPGTTCRWDGTAPICDGECRSDEFLVNRVASGVGQTCWTGSKAYCCKYVTKSSASSLTSSKKHYRIQSKVNNKCLDVVGSSINNGAQIQVYPCHDEDNQRWYLHFKHGYNSIVSVKSKGCLDVNNHKLRENVPVQQWECHDGHNQRWKSKINGDGSVQFISLASGKCMDLRSGTNIVQQYDCHDGDNQKWLITRVVPK